MSPEPADEITIRYNRDRLATQLTVFVAGALLMLWACIQFATSVSVLGFVAWALIGALFVLLSAVTIRRLLKRDLVLVLDREGIIDRVRWGSERGSQFQRQSRRTAMQEYGSPVAPSQPC